MTINARVLDWGVFFITLGAVVLVAQAALVSDADVAAALQYWPILLILLGVGLLLRRTRFGVAGGMLAAAAPGLLLGGVIVAAPQIPADCGWDRPVNLTTQDGTFAGAATVDLRLACGDVTVTAAGGTGWRTETGNGAGQAPVVTVAPDRLTVESATRGRAFHFGQGGDRWRITLPTANPIDLRADVSAGRGTFDLGGARLGRAELTVNAGDARIDLAGATVDELSVDVNAGRVRLLMPSADVTADLSVNAGALDVCTPAGLGLRVHERSTLAGIHFSGLVRVGDAWESPGYATDVHHADVSVSANVGSVDLNPQGGCQ